MKKIVFVVSFLLFITSCKVFSPSEMLRTKINYSYSKFTDEQLVQEYKIAPFDELSVIVSSNNGERLVSTNATTTTTAKGNKYTVEYDGMVKLPVFGRVKISGLTVRETEKTLEDLYSKYINEPFVQLDHSKLSL
ncbi:MAG: hypothetical protein HGB12_11700 [Bacteroidetes bacterium]|nr:hypothetical protein [Bacteroidota bacterium]